MERTLVPNIADHMLAAIDAGEASDYQALLRAAQWPELPRVAFHTAPLHARESIKRDGLRATQPGSDGTDPWPDTTGVYARQKVGVYVSDEPDTRGRWSRWNEWDVWQIDATDMPSQPDTLNARCWILADVPAHRLTLHTPTKVQPSTSPETT